jgi:hypothetical protein
VEVGVIGHSGGRALEQRHGFVGAAALEGQQAEVMQGIRVLGRALKDPPVERFGSVELAAALQADGVADGLVEAQLGGGGGGGAEVDAASRRSEGAVMVRAGPLGRRGRR